MNGFFLQRGGIAISCRGKHLVGRWSALTNGVSTPTAVRVLETIGASTLSAVRVLETMGASTLSAVGVL